ncbi:MAG: hypothetical protein ACE5KH_01675 [Candidatus Geothermarchaeales archaeon]
MVDTVSKILVLAGTLLVAVSAGMLVLNPGIFASHGEDSVTDYVSLIDSLRAAGAAVEPAGEVTQPFFSVKGQVTTVNGGNVNVFEYESTAVADGEAALVSPDGGSVGTTMMMWIDRPHFYKAGRLIVLYVGDSPTVTDALEAVLGPQFAGR